MNKRIGQILMVFLVSSRSPLPEKATRILLQIMPPAAFLSAFVIIGLFWGNGPLHGPMRYYEALVISIGCAFSIGFSLEIIYRNKIRWNQHFS